MPLYQQTLGPNTQAVNQVAHGFLTGYAVYYTGSAWASAKADASATLGIGVVVVLDANNFIVYQAGYAAGLSGFTAGLHYFVSDSSAGLLSPAEPTTTTSYSNPLFFAFSATTGIVLPFRATQISSSISAGGTGQSTATGAFDALAPSSPAQGDIIYYNGTHWVRLAAGTSGQLLQTNGVANPSWVSPADVRLAAAFKNLLVSY